ncbi:thioredoxin family protein [Polaribacter porphyrae]|uniref:Thioredoxin family protein n=1 Tax=Polaribacter porphyrae TaxID=1137780 RepID=A0A2S7WS81_9FLAO|nr:DUF255 domain-containing protein [Polaribacter porphyrae]PQJ80444.1 thioredoxin family protein [Polaribacter porphyrae]
MKNSFIILFFMLMLFSSKVIAQNNSINWITFEQLEDSLKVKPKKVFISFYADWCSYCKKMDKVTFKNDEVISILNKDYYAIKMNAQTKDTITFEKRKYINQQLGKSRKPIHQIPLLLASRKDIPFSLPANLVLDKNFKIIGRYFEYLSSKDLIYILEN